jgi:diadenosine tetraphosphate (Ap4A) HIT family hydrolase
MTREDLGPTGGVVWSDRTEWERRRKPDGCVICRDERPLNVIAETATCWVTAEPDAPLPGYVCVVSKQHVNEPFELTTETQSQFWVEAMTVARAIATETRPIKMNYEIHGNTLPHLHLHLFPRQADDPYVGGPVDPRRASFHRSAEDIHRLQAVVSTYLAS